MPSKVKSALKKTKRKAAQPVQARPSFLREEQLLAFGYARVIGVDEAGRGPLAGPVVAAAIVLPCDFDSPHFALLHDSKQLSEEVRETLYAELTATLDYGVGIVHPDIIDKINIRQASWHAMQIAVEEVHGRLRACSIETNEGFDPGFVLIDGLPYGPGPWPYEAVVKGDCLSLSIAAASVIAKVTRDRLMVQMDALYPDYGFASHKGYGSPAHLKALDTHGPCDLHRKTYAPVRRLLPESELEGLVTQPDE